MTPSDVLVEHLLDFPVILGEADGAEMVNPEDDGEKEDHLKEVRGVHGLPVDHWDVVHHLVLLFERESN